MPTFSVILEDVTSTEVNGRSIPVSQNQRVETIDAADLDAAWVLARHQYYTLKVDGPNAQIVDIEPGEVSIDQFKISQEGPKPLPVGKVDAPPAPTQPRQAQPR